MQIHTYEFGDSKFKSICAKRLSCEICEYTIKDPILNIVTDLYQRKPDVIGFSCLFGIWKRQLKLFNY